MVQTFRLYGPEVGESTAIIDADVTGVTMDGSIELTPSDGDLDSFTLDPDKLRSLVQNNEAYDKAEINTSDPIWKAIEDVETHYEQATDDRQAFIDAAHVLFRGAA